MVASLSTAALLRSPWARMAALITAHDDGGDRERVRSAVARPVFAKAGKMVRYSPAADVLGDGDEYVEPSPELLAFVAHQYAIPAGFLTGADDNEVRDAALHRALDERYLRGTAVPDSFTETTRCPTLAGELGRGGDVATALRAAERRSLLAAIPIALVSIGLTGVLAAAAVVTAADGWQWLLALLFLAAAVTVVWAWTTRLVSAVRFFRLPPATAQRWSDLLLKEAVGVYFHDLYTEGYLPRAWFHDTFCRNQPITRAAFERLGTDTVTRGILVHMAMRQLPALQRAHRRQVRPPAGL
ncbi:MULTISPECIES: hypothetical protein [unclassified Rathayibacter]|uniref:hypothetical protein n=2 Tax=Rathayibacter TaxID=33886 RepID=UPI0011B0D386|nr:MULTISPECIES: hypothetical protein [unclassified Rathayibacter]